VNRWLALPQYVCVVLASASSRGASSERAMSSPNGYWGTDKQSNKQTKTNTKGDVDES